MQSVRIVSEALRKRGRLKSEVVFWIVSWTLFLLGEEWGEEAGVGWIGFPKLDPFLETKLDYNKKARCISCFLTQPPFLSSFLSVSPTSRSHARE